MNILQSNYTVDNKPKVGDTVAIISSYQEACSKLRGRTGVIVEILPQNSMFNLNIRVNNMPIYLMNSSRLMKIEL